MTMITDLPQTPMRHQDNNKRLRRLHLGACRRFGSLGKVIPEKIKHLASSVNADALFSMIEVALRDIMQVLQRKRAGDDGKGKDYAHLAILSLGLWAKSDPNRIVDETGQFKSTLSIRQRNGDKKRGFSFSRQHRYIGNHWMCGPYPIRR